MAAEVDEQVFSGSGWNRVVENLAAPTWRGGAGPPWSPAGLATHGGRGGSLTHTPKMPQERQDGLRHRQATGPPGVVLVPQVLQRHEIPLPKTRGCVGCRGRGRASRRLRHPVCWPPRPPPEARAADPSHVCLAGHRILNQATWCLAQTIMKTGIRNIRHCLRSLRFPLKRAVLAIHNNPPFCIL